MSAPNVTTETDPIISVTFFIPCLNEETRVVPTIETVVAAMKGFESTFEIIVVDDGSTDGTAAVVIDYQRTHPSCPVYLERNPRNFGLARSFVDAAFRGKGRYFRLICGDNIEPEESMAEILRHMGQMDVIIPYYPAIPGKSAVRLAISNLYTHVINAISGHRLHYYNGNPLYRRRDVMRWAPHNYGFGYQADLLTQLLDQGATYLEVPIVGMHRVKNGGSSVRFRNVMSVAHSLLEISIRRLRRVIFPKSS
jgi:glycosyltransferase involved in cell wall biosynthesis